MNNAPPEPTRVAIDALLAYLPDFELAGFTPGAWHQSRETDRGAPSLPSYEFGEAVTSFIATCYEHDWVTPFDWPGWQEAGEQLTEDDIALGNTDTQTIRKLITLHVRKDRFCEGHLSNMFQRGHIVRLLHRLRDIRQAMASGAP
jgi:hypothetical protein